MFRSLSRRLLLLFLCTILAGGSPALAQTVMVTESAPVYASPDGSTAPMGTLPAGVELDCTAVRSGWAMVTANGHTGFMPQSALALVYHGSATAYTVSETAMRSTCSDASAILTTVPAGEAVYVSAVVNGWARCGYAGATGYLPLSALSASRPAVAEPAMAQTAYASEDATRVYDASGRVLGTVPRNTQVTVTAVREGVCRVERGGYTAYMLASELSPTQTEAPAQPQAPAGVTFIAPSTFYVRNDQAKVYDSGARVIGALPVNTAVSVSAYSDTLALIALYGRQGLMYRTDLSDAPVAVTAPEPAPADDGITWIAATTYYVQRSGAEVRAASGALMGTLPVNCAVTVTAYNDQFALVSSNGAQGLMRKGDLGLQRVSCAPDVADMSPATFYVASATATVLGCDGSTLATLSAGAAVTVNGCSDTLARVVNGTSVGYMRKSDLTASAPAAAAPSSGYTLSYGAQGEAVAKVQARLKALGYFTGEVGGNYLDQTRAAVGAYQTAAKLSATGIVDQATLVSLFSDGAPKASEALSTAAPAHGRAMEMDWWKSDIQQLFPRGAIVVVTDVETGLSWREQRRGGTNHADCQPLTAADTAAMKRAYGGSWSWNRRAIIVTINGVNYAASMNGMPHGGGSIADNNFNGHHCIHFTNSRTHGGNKVCPLHQAAIKKAASVTL